MAQEERYEEASELFEESIRESPYYSLAHYGYGKINLYPGGNLDVAVRELKIAVTLDRRLAKAHFYLGMAYYLNRRYTYAISSFNRSYELDDRNVAALYNIAAIYDYIGQKGKSVMFYRRYQQELERERMFD